jgi:two-component system, OmpR family, phosphate regulon response regulator PhoB
MANPTIMVISPDRYQAGKMVVCLQDAGYKVASANPAADVLDDLSRQSPDLLLLEWQLPDPGTLSLVRNIRQDGCLSRLPVILMGVGIREEDALLALDAGADQCWREPFNPRVLVARVHAFLRRNINPRDPRERTPQVQAGLNRGASEEIAEKKLK